MTRTASAKPAPGAKTTSTKGRASSAKKAAPAAAKSASARRDDPGSRPAPPASAGETAPDVRSATATQINFRADPETKAALDELLSLIHISEPTRRTPISYAVFCL